MNKIVNSVLSQILDTNKKIKIPKQCNRVLLDIGTSYNAPHAHVWTRETEDVCVFAFEPNPFNIKCVKSGKWLGSSWQNPLQLDIDNLNTKVFLIESALSDGKPRYTEFYCAEEDPGTSSMYEPTYMSVKEKVNVPVITLKNFFDLFPWDRIFFIEHIKIDTQSSDFDIIKGMGEYIKNVLYLTVECNTIDSNNVQQYNNSNMNPLMMKEYIESYGFECQRWKNNGIFYNTNMKDLWDEYEYYFLENE